MNTKNQQQFALISHDSITDYVREGWFRAIIFSVIWLILSDGLAHSTLTGLIIGVPTVLFATYFSVSLLPKGTLSLMGSLRFIPFFIWNSLYGGIDVGVRAFQSKSALSPALINYPWRLPPGPAQLFMLNVVSLLPGTLSSSITEQYLQLHVLDKNADILSETKILENKVADIFGIKLKEIND